MINEILSSAAILLQSTASQVASFFSVKLVGVGQEIATHWHVITWVSSVVMMTEIVQKCHQFSSSEKKAAPQFFSTLLVFHQTFLDLSIVSETYKAVGSLLLSCLSHCFTPTKQTKHILKHVSQVDASISPKMHFHRRSAHLLCVSAAEPVLLQTCKACLKAASQPPRILRS